MRLTLPIAALAALLSAAGCGNEIGDGCSIPSDCSPNGDRICDIRSPGGYCTIQGCDDSSCPEEAVCVRFFPVTTGNRTCDRANGNGDCTVDEYCNVSGQCAPASTEIRYCMLRCDVAADCRDQYECRDFELMRTHGGEPVVDPQPADADLPPFCAPAPVEI